MTKLFKKLEPIDGQVFALKNVKTGEVYNTWFETKKRSIESYGCRPKGDGFNSD